MFKGALLKTREEDLAVTTNLSERLLRLPLWVGLEGEGAQERVIASVLEFYS